jgi:hypothetical protein
VSVPIVDRATSRTRVIVADDDVLLREGSADVVGYQLAGRACGGVEGAVPGREHDVFALDV